MPTGRATTPRTTRPPSAPRAMRIPISRVPWRTVLVTAACEMPRALGDTNSVVVAADTDFWNQVRDTVQSALEPTIFTVRRERTFTLTHQDPTEESWGRLQLFRQELVIGTPQDAWVQAVVEAWDGEDPIAPPRIIQAHDVWARNQLVTAMVLPPGNEVEALHSLLGELHDLMDQQYRDWAIQKMFVSGRDTALADSLRREHGFRLTVPRVYRRAARDSVFIFRNDNPDPSQLIRQVTVTWRSPIPDAFPADSMLEWRNELAQVYYSYPQVLDTTRIQRRAGEVRGHRVREVQAVWANPPEDAFPAGGPFILRAVACEPDDRLYLLDAWLYAPQEEKYEFMIQLQHILDSFRCE